MVRMGQKESVKGLSDALALGFSYNLKSMLTAAPSFFFWFFKFIYLFICGCVGSSVLCEGFL